MNWKTQLMNVIVQLGESGLSGPNGLWMEVITEEPSPLYENNHYHEECLRCNSCGLNLTGPNQKRARRFKNQILCDLHFADVALMECSDFMQQLRSFKPQSLGCAVARRKSSTTLIFPLPPQACSGEEIAS
uniref:LIM zinc-binding domain-containing protein n=1 Tax=Anopheles merus TaxID=30066 RepID=A0A182VHK2_ANOME